MLTGVRTQEMRFATWEEVDLEKGIWEIPAERMKMRRPHIVPLSIQVVDLLNSLNLLQAIILSSLLAGTITANRSRRKACRK